MKKVSCKGKVLMPYTTVLGLEIMKEQAVTTLEIRLNFTSHFSLADEQIKSISGLKDASGSFTGKLF